MPRAAETRGRRRVYRARQPAPRKRPWSRRARAHRRDGAWPPRRSGNAA